VNSQIAQTVDRGPWRRFFWALGGLALALLLALYATGLRQVGRYATAGALAAMALLLAGVIAAYAVPYLARRTTLRRWMVRIDYEFTREGAVYLLLVVAIIIAALNTGNNLLFIILACLLAGIVASGILSRIVLSDVELELALPEHLFAGHPVESKITLRNQKRLFPSFSLTVSAASAGGSKDSRRPAPSTPEILDRPVYFPFLPRRSSATERVEMTFPRRGRYTQGAFRLSTKFPFGLLRKSREMPAGQEIVVLPSVQPADEFHEILPRLAGEMESFIQGRGHDLYAIRDYQVTDIARHVDWKATAKAGQLKVREYTREEERRVTLVFDARLPETSPAVLARFEKAVALAASLAWHFCEVGLPMRFVTQGFESGVEPVRAAIYPILESLALVEPIEPTNVGSAIVDTFFERLAAGDGGFNVVFTSAPRASIPAALWHSSHVTFIDSLR